MIVPLFKNSRLDEMITEQIFEKDLKQISKYNQPSKLFWYS